jgi:4-alpha-glucanotransferase
MTMQNSASDVERWQKSPTVCYEEIRAFKYPLFKCAFERFKKEEWGSGSVRDKSFRSFMEEEAAWLEDYALFRSLKEKQPSHWVLWPTSFRRRYPLGLSKLKEEAADMLLFFKYLQWAISEQWQSVRHYAREKNILIMGDIPFLVSPDSADIWSRRKEFCLAANGIPEVSVGAPPDFFNEHGQAWGLPMFSWEKMEQSGFQWWRERIRKAKKEYDMIRLDHIVGFFRVWVFPQNGSPHFEPKDEEKQKERGRFFLQLLLEEAGDCMLVAEDLGVIPPFVREQLNAFRIPGIKVVRWEKKESAFISPRTFSDLSLATTGTHDTSALASWWNEMSNEERSHFLAAFDNKRDLSSLSHLPFSDEIHRLIVRGLMESGSAMVVLPMQDILAETDQINFPGTISSKNWRYRIPENVEALSTHPRYQCKIDFLKSAIEKTARSRENSYATLSL